MLNKLKKKVTENDRKRIHHDQNVPVTFISG